MVDSSDFSRRAVLRAGAATVGLGGIGAASAHGGAVGDDEAFDDAERVPPVDVSESEDQLETVSPASVAPEQSSGIGPGTMLFITREDASGTAGCTANFVWEGADGTRYLGAAGHCFLPTGADADQNAGGDYDSSKVTVRACVDCSFGGTTALTGLVRGEVVELGSVAYARQTLDGTDVGNDFGLVEIPSSADGLVDPSMPTWGGPTTAGAINAGDRVVHYGNGVATGETFVTKNRAGVGVTNDGQNGAWVAELPASPGDSGAGVEVARASGSGLRGEQAAGVLTHLVAGGTAGTNVAKAEELAAEAGLDVSVVTV